MQLARQWLQMHFVMHVLLEKDLPCSFGSKNFCKFCTMFCTPKWGLKNGPKNGARIWPPKRGPKMAPKKGATYFDLEEIKALSKTLGPLFGCHFWTPFWGSNSGTIFGSIFQPPFWGTKHGAKFAKVFAPKAAWQIFFQQTCITKWICSHCPASCISEQRPILFLAKPSKKTTSFDCQEWCTWARWIRASEPDTVEALTCGTGFPHEKWPPF